MSKFRIGERIQVGNEIVNDKVLPGILVIISKGTYGTVLNICQDKDGIYYHVDLDIPLYANETQAYLDEIDLCKC